MVINCCFSSLDFYKKLRKCEENVNRFFHKKSFKFTGTEPNFNVNLLNYNEANTIQLF